MCIFYTIKEMGIQKLPIIRQQFRLSVANTPQAYTAKLQRVFHCNTAAFQQ
jgi:hypothetical protein